MHPLVERVLDNRSIQDRHAFLNPEYTARHNPFLLKDMDVAVERILKAIQSGESIAVWHDYDCDGVPGGALMYDFFKAIAYSVRMYVPERSEGYGLNNAGIEKLKREGVTLIITIDCGITDVVEVELARELGIDVIVTDHHLPAALPPRALAIINAHQVDDEYPFKGLCGTGVAFKLVEGLIARGDFKLAKGWEKWLLDLVALATVADMVPLVGENRTLASFGLRVLRKTRRVGLRALFESQRIPISSATEDDLAFSIAPKVNASSRMGSPRIAFELLTTDDPKRATELAKQLVKLNQERKLEGMRVAKEVKKRIETMPRVDDVIVIGHSSWRPSLLGIAATAAVETYQRTVCLWGKDGELIKGSCRSDGTVNIVMLMEGARHVFKDFGGHELSGGFSLEADAVHRLEEALIKSLHTLDTSPAVEPEVEPDGLITIAEANEEAYESLRTLAPFGEANPKPLFRLANVRIEKQFRFGVHKDHARLVLSDESGRTIDAVSFFVSRALFRTTLEIMSPGDRVTVDGSLERSHFGGRSELRFRIGNVIA